MNIDTGLVRLLIAAQFPQWATLPVVAVLPGGWDNRTFRLGDRLSVRLPSHAGYAAQVRKEQRWLPILAPQLPLPIPVPVAEGVPSDQFPLPWSIYEWIDGQVARDVELPDPAQFATDLARFLVRLRSVDPTDGPLPGEHNFHRGGSLRVYDDETRSAIGKLGDTIDVSAATEIWDAALDSTWDAAPLWFHGDVAMGNLLVRDGRLGAVIDFGLSGVGDPACDIAIAFGAFDQSTREVFRSALDLDNSTWARGRGWALWKALIDAAGAERSQSPARAEYRARHIIEEVIADHKSHGVLRQP